MKSSLGYCTAVYSDLSKSSLGYYTAVYSDLTKLRCDTDFLMIQNVGTTTAFLEEGLTKWYGTYPIVLWCTGDNSICFSGFVYQDAEQVTCTATVNKVQTLSLSHLCCS